jgi:hypothetical protein
VVGACITVMGVGVGGSQISVGFIGSKGNLKKVTWCRVPTHVFSPLVSFVCLIGVTQWNVCNFTREIRHTRGGKANCFRLVLSCHFLRAFPSTHYCLIDSKWTREFNLITTRSWSYCGRTKALSEVQRDGVTQVYLRRNQDCQVWYHPSLGMKTPSKTLPNEAVCEVDWKSWP